MTEAATTFKTTSTTRAIAQPMLFFMDRPEDRAAWRLFLDEHPRTRVIDRFEEGLRELLAVKLPSLESGSPAFEMQFKVFRAQYALSRGSDELGVWVYYPWRGEAVHLLPAEEYFAVRTGRNRNVITPDDQQKFRAATVGIAGLSVGGSVALALALAGGCEQMVLSDHDGLEVSNLNRLPQSTTGLGVNKAVLAARQIYEINPYAKVLVLSDGLNRTNIDAFMTGPPRLDVIIDEMDDLAMKWDLREAAQKNRIPVLMTTCVGEKILLDVERYDRNPERQFFVRKVSPDWRARVGKKLSRTEWVDAVSEIVGADEVPEAVRASNAAIGREVTTRPLLGTTVAVAGPLVANAVRAIATGAPLADGRYRLDLGAVLSPSTIGPAAPPLQLQPTTYQLPASQKTPSWNIEKWERALETKPAAYWERLGERQALKTFRLAAARVPAYQDFLKKNNVDPAKILTIDDFKNHVPVTDKENYLRAYPLASLCVDGALHKSPMISVSSGSSGKPFFWPRGDHLDREGALVHELIFRAAFEIHKKSTLVIVGFSMGSWIAGNYTAASVRAFQSHGYKLNLATPGIEIEDALPLIAQFKDQVDQIIIAGYPPFIKDILDSAIAAGIELPLGRTRLLFAGEGFSHSWREAMLQKIGSTNPLTDAINIYGTADAAIIGHETPASIAARNWCHANPAVGEQIFGDERMPTLVQYHPYFKYLETTAEGEIAFTSHAGFPLVRYNIHDVGGVVPFDRMTDALAPSGFSSPNAWRLPYAYLFGRKQLATTIYAVNIYLENIQAALAHPDIRQLVSGKSVMGHSYDANWDQYWWIKAETAPGVAPTPDLEKNICNAVVETLTEKNSEFRRLYGAVGARAVPKVTVLPFGAPEFRVKNKHRWANGNGI